MTTKTTQTTHTPTPWSEPCPYAGNRYELMGTINGTREGQPGAPSIAVFRALEDARFAQRAVNSHAALVEAIEDLLGDRPAVTVCGICQWCGRDYADDVSNADCPSDDCPSFKARAALALARGTEGT